MKGRLFDYWFQLNCVVSEGKEDDLISTLHQLKVINDESGNSSPSMHQRTGSTNCSSPDSNAGMSPLKDASYRRAAKELVDHCGKMV